MGCMILRHARKVAVYRDGERVREWPVPQGEPLVDPLQHMLSGPYRDALLGGSTASQAAWQRSACGYLVMTRSVPDRRPQDPYDRAAALALTGRSLTAGGPGGPLVRLPGRELALTDAHASGPAARGGISTPAAAKGLRSTW